MSHEIPYGSEIETCAHDSCLDPKRYEYCEVEARDIAGDAIFNVDLIDCVLQRQEGTETGIEYIGDGKMRYLMYNFNHVEKDGVLPPIQVNTAITHTYDVPLERNTYQITISWRVDHPDANDAVYTTSYWLEQYPNVIYSTIGEHTLLPESALPPLQTASEQPALTDRPMTGYDHRILRYHLLDTFNARQMRMTQRQTKTEE